MAKTSRSKQTSGRTRRPVRTVRTLHDLTTDRLNANRGTARGGQLLATSLQEFGAGRSVLVDRAGRIIAGNKTIAHATTLALPIHVVPTTGERLVVVQRTDLDLETDARARQLALADNRIAELNLEWDPALLKDVIDSGIDLQDLWTPDELEQLFGEGLHTGETPEDSCVAPRATDIQRGDLFSLGPHRLLCGDSTSAEDVHRLLEDGHPVLMATDPPYGVEYDATWRAKLPGAHGTAVGRVTHDDQVDWRAAFQHFHGSVTYVWHAGLFAGQVAEALAASGFLIRAQIIWVKQHFAFGRGDYHWQHEPCWYAVRRGKASQWRGDRTQTTVWHVPNLNPLGGTRADDNAATGHSTQKPVRLFERPILHHTRLGDPIYDPFVGSGTAIIAAQKTGRRCYALEIEPTYVQAVIDRWEAFTGEQSTQIRSRE